MRKAICLLLGCTALWGGMANWAVASDGLQPSLSALTWARLQGRIILATQGATLRTSTYSFETEFSGFSLMGDYYVGRSWRADASGGLRVTTGVVRGTLSGLWSTPTLNKISWIDQHPSHSPTASSEGDAEFSTSPYIGIGYSSLSVPQKWGFSADLGLLSLSASSPVRLGHVLGNTLHLDDTLRNLKWAPVLQVGVSYSF